MSPWMKPHTTRGLRAALTLVIFGMFLGLAPQLGRAPVAGAQTAAPQAGATVYLPLVVTRGSGQTTPPPTTPTRGGAFFVEPG